MHSIKARAAGAVLILLAAGAAGAQQVDGQKLAASRACMACHQVDSKRVGPPLRSVAERYAGQSEAAEYLANKIRGGGRGAWGVVPMPAQNHVSEQDAKQLAEWVLSLAPPKAKP
ncbi:c-type cytochrome [Bordetella ansorpii]|uniref:c-type cytochrome n=1 Tax=Bordetella ansorpii TaxID=288768 RepID=UPI000825EAE0|nr:c-type cytochrome [Bordetella ansorpii]